MQDFLLTPRPSGLGLFEPPRCFARVTWVCCPGSRYTELYQRLASVRDVLLGGWGTGIRTQE